MKKTFVTSLFLLISSCLPMKTPEVQKGECILGTDMDVWKMLRKDKEIYLFVQLPQTPESLIHTVTDLSTFKKVECPK